MGKNRTLPDTCAWIDFLNGRQTSLASAVERLLIQGEAVICGVVLYELMLGIRSTKEEKIILSAFQAVPQLVMTDQTWVSAGRLSATLRGKGYTLPFSDILIAEICLEHDVALLSTDRHFDLVPGLLKIAG